jgi:hypothetical protein
MEFLNTTKPHIPKVLLYISHDEFEIMQKMAILFYEKLEFGWVPQKNKRDFSIVVYTYEFKDYRYQKFTYPNK